MQKFDIELDTSALQCPFPIVETRKQLMALHKGQILKVIYKDPASVIDLHSLIAVSGEKLLSHEEKDERFIFYIEKCSESIYSQSTPD